MVKPVAGAAQPAAADATDTVLYLTIRNTNNLEHNWCGNPLLSLIVWCVFMSDKRVNSVTKTVTTFSRQATVSFVFVKVNACCCMTLQRGDDTRRLCYGLMCVCVALPS